MAVLEERIEDIMERVGRAGDNHVERAAALEEHLTLARAHDGETWFDSGAWSEDLPTAISRSAGSMTRSA